MHLKNQFLRTPTLNHLPENSEFCSNSYFKGEERLLQGNANQILKLKKEFWDRYTTDILFTITGHPVYIIRFISIKMKNYFKSRSDKISKINMNSLIHK